jgi:hypothetical protein
MSISKAGVALYMVRILRGFAINAIAISELLLGISFSTGIKASTASNADTNLRIIMSSPSFCGEGGEIVVLLLLGVAGKVLLPARGIRNPGSKRGKPKKT